jgi:thioredoxin 1
MGQNTKTVTDQSFQADVLSADKPVLVDFWAEWCGPCRMIAPALEEIAAELGDQVTVAKINIDENPDTPGRYGVRGIPTMRCSRMAKRLPRRSGQPRAARSAVAWSNLGCLPAAGRPGNGLIRVARSFEPPYPA